MRFNMALSHLKNASLLLSIPVSLFLSSISSPVDAATLKLLDVEPSRSQSNVQPPGKRLIEDQFLRPTRRNEWVIQLNKNGTSSVKTSGADVFEFRVGDHPGRWDFNLVFANNQTRPNPRLRLFRSNNLSNILLEVNKNNRNKTLFSQRNGNYLIRGNAQGTIKATATIPEPISTTAAVGLAIAGAARTLKKKRSEDA